MTFMRNLSLPRWPHQSGTLSTSSPSSSPLASAHRCVDWWHYGKDQVGSLVTFLQCQHDGEIRYEFPGYNVTEAPQNSWRLPPAGEDFVYGGVLLKSRCV